jgi:hypothetical protein
MNKSLLYKFTLGLFLLAFIACQQILLEDKIADKEIVLIAPAEKSVSVSTGMNLYWEALPGATKYRLQIAKPNFANPVQIVLDTLITKTNCLKQLNIGSYEWRVKGLNSAYETPFKSRFFTVAVNEDFSTNFVNLVNPVNNFATNKNTQNLSWEAIVGATSYLIQIYDDKNTVIYNQTVATTNVNYSFAEGNFSWKVRANNDTKQTPFSSRNILVDTTVPNTPVLSSPANSSASTNTATNFIWNRTSIAGSVEKDSLYLYTDKALTQLQSKKEATSPATATLVLGTYYWYIKSFDTAGNTSEKSTIFSFSVN